MNLRLSILLLLLFMKGFCACQNSTSRRSIYLLTLLPYPNEDLDLHPSWEEGDNIRPALELAMDQINSNTSLLHEYKLQLLHADGGCQVTTTTVVSFTKNAFQPLKDRVAGIIGPGCSFAATILGNLTNKTELSLVHVHGAGNPVLANRTLYPHMLGTLGSVDIYVQGFLSLLHTTSWNRVAILYDSARIFYLNTLRLLLDRINATFLSPVSNTFIPLSAIREQLLRVTFVLCPPELTRQIVCLAYNSGMISDSYQWVIMDKILDELKQPIEFVYDGLVYNCSTEDMLRALDKAVLLSYKLTPPNDSDVISNITYEEYRDYYEQYRETYNLEEPLRFSNQKPSVYTRWATYLYDAVWAWALVLDNLTKSTNRFEIGGDYGNRNQADLITEQFYRTKFNGMSGEVSFNRSTGYVERPVDLFQVVNNRSVQFATVRMDQNMPKLRFRWISDSFPVNTKESSRLGIFFTILIIIQLIIIVALHILNVVYCKRPHIKSSSPRLLHISYLGTYVTALGMFFWSFNIAAELDSHIKPYICQLFWTWCIPLGFTLSFLPVVLRTWRIYRIFKHYLNPGPLISDRILIGFVFLAFLVVLALGVTWTVTDPFHLVTSSKMLGSKVQVKQICFSKYHFLWFAILSAWMLSVVVVPIAVLLFLTRSIPNKSFTTESLRAFSCTMIVILFLGFTLYYITVLVLFDPVYNFSVLSILINLLVASFIISVFMPPLLPVFRSKCYRDTTLLTLKSRYSSPNCK